MVAEIITKYTVVFFLTFFANCAIYFLTGFESNFPITLIIYCLFMWCWEKSHPESPLKH